MVAGYHLQMCMLILIFLVQITLIIFAFVASSICGAGFVTFRSMARLCSSLLIKHPRVMLSKPVVCYKAVVFTKLEIYSN